MNFFPSVSFAVLKRWDFFGGGGGGGVDKNTRIVYLIRAKLFVKIKHQPSIKFISLLSLSEDWTDCSSALLWFSTVYRM